jgi:hypothetical protein
LLLPVEAFSDCPPFCFEAAASDILLTGGAGWNTLPVARSRTDGTFTITNAYVGDFGAWAANPAAVKLTGDFDGNGWTDVALTGVPGWGSVPIAFANGDGTFHVTNDYIGEFATWAASSGVVPIAGDLNADGYTDIALTGHPGWATLPVALSMGPGPFLGRFIVYNTPIADFAAWAANPAAVKLAGDFNGDGRTDIALTGVVGWATVPVAFADGFGGFDVTNVSGTAIEHFAENAAATGATPYVGHFDSDAKADIALTGNGFSVMPVAHSLGNGSFTVTNFYPSDVGYPAFYNFAVFAGLPGAVKRTGDFNGDGLTDIALLFHGSWPNGFYENEWILGVALSNGNGTFETPSTLHTPLAHWYDEGPTVDVLAGDYNGDGRSDLAVVGLDANVESEALVGFSNGDGTFHVVSAPLGEFGFWAFTQGTVKLDGEFN